MHDSAEEWKPVVGFEGRYEVSSLGRVRRLTPGTSAKVGHNRQPTVTCRGYCILRLTTPGVRGKECKLVHNLVTEAFLGPKPPGWYVNHIDGVKTNNAIQNLEYVTPTESAQHAIRTGLLQRELTPEQVREVRALKGHLGAIRAAKLLGISKTTIGNIWRREYYADID